MPVERDPEELELLAGFVEEMREVLQDVEPLLIELEQAADHGQAPDPESLNRIFRLVHSMKGVAGFLNLPHVVSVSHEAESLLDFFRSGKASINSHRVDILCRTLDLLSQMLQAIEEFQTDESLAVPAAALVEVLKAELDLIGSGGGEKGSPETKAEPAITPAAASTAHSIPLTIDLDSSPESTPSAEPDAIRDLVATPEPGATSETTVPVASIPPPTPPPAPAKATAPVAASAARKSSGEQSTIRVDVQKLDSLMNLVGELIIASTSVTRNPDLEGQQFERFQKAALHLTRITRSLHDIAMSVRMVPVGPSFRRMLRVVRDVAHKVGREVELELRGQGTEVDKNVIDALGDPLVHIIRNAVDHGIEPPDEREKKGKSRVGRIILEAKHQGGEVWIVIRDDGGGICREAVIAKAASKGLIDPETPPTKDSDIFDLLMQPGFSTTEKVSSVSGRGVGLDVVKKNIETLGGRVDVSSPPGGGTVFTLRIPLTLAIIDGMLIAVGDSIYTIPILSIRESIQAKAESIVRVANGAEVVRLRNRYLPVLRLHRLYGIETDVRRLIDGTLVIVEDEAGEFCIFVDRVVGQRQTVIKGLGDYLGRLPGISGCSILGSGDISLILDVSALAVVARGTDREREAA